MPLAKALLERKLKAEAFIQNLIKQKELVNYWPGTKKIRNPSIIDPKTGEAIIIGWEDTRNIDVTIPENMRQKFESILEKLNGTGEYLRNMFGQHTELICIKLRENAKGDLVLQYTEENTGNKMEADSEQIDEIFAKERHREITVDTSQMVPNATKEAPAMASDGLDDF